MSFYLILSDYYVDWSGQEVIHEAVLYHVFPSPNSKSYNLYVLEYTSNTFTKIFFKWPKKRISRKFIEIHFKCRRFYGEIPGETVRELVKNMKCENYILVQ
jgi:hypothetical protein